MLDALKSFLSTSKTVYTVNAQVPCVQVASSALLVEAALVDGTFDETERLQVKDVLAHMFELPESELNDVIEDAIERVAQSNQMYGFARAVKDNMEYDRRVELMQMLWEIVYADGVLDDFEANLVRRVSGLLYVTDQDSGRARKAALEHLGLDQET